MTFSEAVIMVKEAGFTEAHNATDAKEVRMVNPNTGQAATVKFETMPHPRTGSPWNFAREVTFGR
jgi:hypothetical protein